jgi:hypothetical protein
MDYDDLMYHYLFQKVRFYQYSPVSFNDFKCRLPTPDSYLGCQLATTNYQLPTTNCQLPTGDWQLATAY